MLYIGTDSGVYRWFSGLPWPVFHALQDRRIVSLASHGEGLMAALDGEGRLAVSRDAGMNWVDWPLPAGVGRPTHVRVCPTTQEVILATAGPLGLYARPTRVRVKRVRRQSAWALATRWIAERRARSGGAETALLDPEQVTSQRGWKRLNVPGVELASALAGFEALVLGEAGPRWFASVARAGLFQSDDQGISWQRAEGAGEEVLCLRGMESLLAAGTVAGVSTSNDGGQTWSRHTDGLAGITGVTALEIKPSNPKMLWAGAVGEGDRALLFESKDGGQSWKRVARGFPSDLPGERVVDIRYDRNEADCALVALASGEVYRTHTDGMWWEPISRQIKAARALCAAV